MDAANEEKIRAQSRRDVKAIGSHRLGRFEQKLASLSPDDDL